MQLNDLSPAAGSTKAKKRVGRGTGSGWGKTSGSGHKGQKSRSGGTIKPGFEGGQMPLQMRLPKYGFNSRIARVTAEIRSGELNRLEGDVVNLESLKAAGLITSRITRVRIMLSGEVTKKVTVEDVGVTVAVTKGARAAIEQAGGKIVEAAPEPADKKQKKQKKQAQTASVETAPAAAAPVADETADAAQEKQD